MTRLFFILIWVSILFPLLSPIWAQEYSELWGATGEKRSPTSRYPIFPLLVTTAEKSRFQRFLQQPTLNLTEPKVMVNTRIPKPFWMLLLPPLTELS